MPAITESTGATPARNRRVAGAEARRIMDLAAGHYEETNSAGWDVAADMLAALSQLTGIDDRSQINAAFPGYHHRYPPRP